MTSLPPPKQVSFASRLDRRVGSWLRQARYQWFNRLLISDLLLALAVFMAAFHGSFYLPRGATPSGWGGWVPLASLLTLAVVLGFEALRRVNRHLGRVSEYENLRTAEEPVLWRSLRLVLRWPCSSVVLFSTLLGLALGSWLEGEWRALRKNLYLVTTPLGPVALAVRSWVGDSDDLAWPKWAEFLLSSLYTYVVLALIAAWFALAKQRQQFVLSLFSEEARPASPYGARPTSLGGAVEPEPHEQVLLMRADRIRGAALPYFDVELSSPDWSPDEAPPDRCQGAIAALHRVFKADPEGCWAGHAGAGRRISKWLLGFLGRLLAQDTQDSGLQNDFVIGETVRSLSVVIATCPMSPDRPADGAVGISDDPGAADRFRGHLRELFVRSARRPELLIAACDAAEVLGTAEDLRLLDEQTRHLDTLAGFTIEQSDRILLARDRVLAREPLRSSVLEQAIRRAEGLGMERVRGQGRSDLRFRRPRDGGIMALILPGSFVRGDERAETTSPRRRVHLGAFLIDVSPLPQDAFSRWVQGEGGVLRLERGFFPVQDLSEEVTHDLPFAAHVTWFAAQAYSAWAVPGGRLPTEAQWEKVARGPEDERRFPGGDTWSDSATVSPYGVSMCDLLEWAADGFDRIAYRHNPSVFDPLMVPSGGTEEEAPRCVRGRNPGSPVGDYSLVNRWPMEPITGAFTAPVGFRVAVDLDRGADS